MMRTAALVSALACVHSAFGSAPSSPCATTAPGTCASFTCPANSVPKAGAIFCGNAHGPACSSHLCCDIVTTVTTTPAPTCQSFSCPHGWNKKADSEKTVCATGSCDKATCCAVDVPPCTTVTTTPAPTCESFTCPDGFSNNKADVVCTMGKCNKATCCTAIITTITTTPAPTCQSFTCPHGWNKKGDSEKIVCATGSCDKATCCAVAVPPCTTVTTTPAPTCESFICPDGFSKNKADIVCTMGKCNKATCCTAIITTVTTTPAPKTTPSNPCAPSVLGRKYDAKESALVQEVAAPKKEAGMMAAWAFPLFGVAAMFSFAAFVAVRIRSNQRSTRRFESAEAVQLTEELDDMPFLSDDGPVE